MDVATALSVAQTLFATLQCAEVKNLCSMLKYEAELQKLLDTVKTIKRFLQDADSKCQELTNEGQDWVENLKNAVYDADDLLDEFNTIAQRQKSMPGGKITKKVRRFFSSNNKLMFAFNTSREIKKLREKLDSLAKNHRDFGFSDLYKPAKSREETCSYVYERDIIGRDADKEAIVGMLLQENLEKKISFVTIVGIGGLGKTSLAQLVFRDHRIKAGFQKKMWVCVSENFSLKDVLGKMLGKNDLEFEDLQQTVQEQIVGKRYLLVLDDVWSENSRKWEVLRNFLIVGGKGSRILVTSRSKKVAAAIGNYPIYDLQGLSERDSWELFEKIALGGREDQADAEPVEIGKDILGKCANVPLAIRVIASLLRCQDKATWQSFKSIDLAKMRDGEDDLMPTLMFSYYHLAPELKCCFSFCSIFPQDYVIRKEELISMWLAHGYLVPSNDCESMEDVGETYFSILLHRCFFREIRRDGYGMVDSFKMHDLIHDLARKVAGKDSLMLNATTKAFEGKIRHLSTRGIERLVNWVSSSNHSIETLRTCFNLTEHLLWYFPRNIDVDAIFPKCRRLRVLHLRRSQITGTSTVPDTLGKLLHLRYLDLSNNNELEMLPKSITKLHNLQILKLGRCKNFKELPEDMSKLVNLRILDIFGCDRLSHMPAGLDMLTRLQILPVFVVCGNDNSNSDKIGKLIDLKALSNLRGVLRVIHYGSDYIPSSVTKDGANEVAILKAFKLRCEFWSSYEEGHETLLENTKLLENNHNFRELTLKRYAGTKLPSWVTVMASSLPGLVSIDLSLCKQLHHLSSSMSRLCHLKNLRLQWMDGVEYIDSDAPSLSAKFFPSLERLVLCGIDKLKGWWRDIRWMEKQEGGGCLVDGNEQPVFLPSFPRLHFLRILYCKRMTYFPPCPHVKVLELHDVNEARTFCMKGGVVQSPIMRTTIASSSSSSSNVSSYTLQKLRVDNTRVLNFLLGEFVGGAVHIDLVGMKNLGRIREGFQSCVSSLQNLVVLNCSGLEDLAGAGIQHLANLKSLKVVSWDENLEGLPWEALHSLLSLEISVFLVTLPQGIQSLTSLLSLQIKKCFNLEDLEECLYSLSSLRFLQLESCWKLESLPETMRYLTSLTTLHIKDCRELKSLPEAMCHLTSLTTLKIADACKELKDRCRKQDGEDWPKISHIPNLHIF